MKKSLLKHLSDWTDFKRKVIEFKPYFGGNPEEFPCVCISDYDYNNEIFVVYFVYLSDFNINEEK